MVHPARVLWKLSQSGSLALSLAVLALPAAAAEPDRNLAAVESQAAGVVRIARRPARPATLASTATSAQFTNSAAQPDLQPRGQQSQTAQTSRPQQTRLQPAMSQPPVDQRSTSTIQQVGHAQPAPDCPPFTIVPCPVEPRWAAPSANPNAPGMLGCRCESTVLSEKYPDEYLCDGGDRDRPVHYEAYTRQGLDTEDTVAEFTDHTGKERMRPSNRVCLYAPRFSTIRTVSRPHEGMNLNEIAKVGQSVGTDQFHTRLKLTHHVKNEMTGRVAVRSRASGLDSEQIQGNVSEAKPLVIHEKLLNVYQNLSFVRLGKFEKRKAALLN